MFGPDETGCTSDDTGFLFLMKHGLGPMIQGFCCKVAVYMATVGYWHYYSWFTALFCSPAGNGHNVYFRQPQLDRFFSPNRSEGTDDPAASKMPTVVWFHVHGNQQVRIVPADDNRYIIEDGSNGVVLLIDSVQLEDEGTYMCEGRNIYGSDSRMLSLNVTCQCCPAFLCRRHLVAVETV